MPSLTEKELELVSCGGSERLLAHHLVTADSAQAKYNDLRTLAPTNKTSTASAGTIDSNSGRSAAESVWDRAYKHDGER